MTPAHHKVVHVAVGVVWRHGRMLIARRPQAAHQGGLLEFPGGKVEPGESARQALVRELWEETAITVAPECLRPLIGIRHDYGDKEVFLDVWECHESEGEPRGMEGQPVFWMAPEDLIAPDFPPANRPIIAAVRLPPLLAITGDAADTATALNQLEAGLPRTEGGWIMPRMRSLAPEAYTDLLRQIRARAPGITLLAHDRPELVSELAALWDEWD
ncbi:MAG: 8-oxo-dGTP diphosphatase MutT, partial [Marinobacter sp.]